MKLEIYQEGAPKIGDTLVYCGQDAWCWQKPAVVRVTKTIVEKSSINVSRAQAQAIFSAWGISLLALLVSVLAIMRASRRGRWG